MNHETMKPDVCLGISKDEGELLDVLKKSQANWKRYAKYSLPQPSELTAMTARSKDVTERIFGTAEDAHAAKVYHFDMEVDDGVRLKHAVPTWLAQDAKNRASLVLVAGGHLNGEDTFARLVAETARELGDTDPAFKKDNVKGDKVQVGDITVIRGGPLKAKTSEQQTLASQAAKRVASTLGDTPFVWHNNTSQALFSSLPEDTIKRCRTHVNTCGEVLAPERPYKGANRNFDEEAYQKTLALCRKHSVPFVNVTGSTLGHERITLSEVPGFSDFSQASAVDPQHERKAGYFSETLLPQWAGRFWGGLTQQNGAAVSSHVQNTIDASLYSSLSDSSVHRRRSLHGALEPIKQVPGVSTFKNLVDTYWYKIYPETQKLAKSVYEHWAAKPCLEKQYSAKDCELKSAGKRAHAIRYNSDCIINGPIGDASATPLDGSVAPPGLKFLPFKVEYADTEAGTKLDSLTLDTDPNAPLTAVNVDESIIDGIFLAIAEREKARQATESADSLPIFDTEYAEQGTVFNKAMTRLVSEILPPLEEKRASQESKVQKLREEVENLRAKAETMSAEGRETEAEVTRASVSKAEASLEEAKSEEKELSAHYAHFSQALANLSSGTTATMCREVLEASGTITSTR